MRIVNWLGTFFPSDSEAQPGLYSIRPAARQCLDGAAHGFRRDVGLGSQVGMEDDERWAVNTLAGSLVQQQLSA